MKKTIGQMIKELENDLSEVDRANRQIHLWQRMFELAGEKEQRKMVKDLLVGFGLNPKDYLKDI